MLEWRNLTPVYVPALSEASLLARDQFFNIGDAHFTPDDTDAPHLHDSYELGYIRQGHGIIVLGQNEYQYEPGQIYIINDYEPHWGYTSELTSDLFVIHFHPMILDDSWLGRMRGKVHLLFTPDFSPQGPLVPLDDPFTGQVRGILEQIRCVAAEKDELWEVIVGGMLIQAVGLLTRRLLQQAEASPEDRERREALKRIAPILRLVDNSFHEPLSLDDMARSAHVSRSHCCALFRVALGTTPVAYRNARRLREARRLLLSTNLSVKEISYQIGFSSVQEFDRLFHREVGCTPSQFRTQC